MALLEINLEKPALMEEIVDEDAPGSTGGLTGRTTRTTRRGSGGGSPLGKMAMVGAIVAAAVVLRRLRGGGSSARDEPEGVEVPIESGSSGSGNRSQMRRVAGIVLAVLGAVAVARRMGSNDRQ